MQLNDAHRAQVMRFITYCKGKRERMLVERNAEAIEFKGDRLADDSAIYNKVDVEDLVNTYHAMMVGSSRESMEELINLSAVTMAQMLALGEQAGLVMDSVDVAAIDQNGAAAIASMATQGKAPPGSAAKLPGHQLPSLPVDDSSLKIKCQELEEENRQMRERYQSMQVQVSELLRERSQLSEELSKAAAGAAVQPPPPPPAAERFSDSTQFKELKALMKKKSEEVKELRQFITASGLQIPNTGGGVEIPADDN
mmetsp:Transcript_13698/g.39458  ORF Transcript_13698/g.39458 Transcript_13698/m.39458 type:complete len:254 (-) Transcript_13698:157-918(-)